MQDPELSLAIRCSTEEVLETMFFTSTIDPDESIPPSPTIASSLTFHGEPSGVFQVDVAENAAQSLAASFLGDDEALSEQRVHEVVGEVANMLCGCILSRLDGHGLFELSQPQLQSLISSEASIRESFTLPEGDLTVSLQFQELT